VADSRKLRKRIAGVAGRTAAALLRTTSQRAKLSSLHLPLSLRPARPQPILLHSHSSPQAPAPTETPEDEQQTAIVEPIVPMPPEVRALRSRLAVAERRNARLRYALQRERLAAARAGAIKAQPQPLIDHLVADIGAAGSRDEARLRQTITSVLAAYGLSVPPAGTPSEAPVEEANSVPGFDRRRLETTSQQIVVAQPEIGSKRYVQVTLDALARQGALSLAQIGCIAEMTSPVARRRLRLTVEALCAAGIVRRSGSHYSLAEAPADRSGH
jgi:hypothetical protein